MTNEELLQAMLALLSSVKANDSSKANDNDNNGNGDNEKVEMLTIKECTEVAHGLTEHTIRQLIAQNKIPYIRTGQGKRGKMLINKRALLDYLT